MTGLGKNIIIYGAGAIATTVVAKFIYENRKDTIKVIAVSKKEGNPTNVLGIPVMEIDSLDKEAQECTVLLSMKVANQEEIRAYIGKRGFCNIASIYEGTWKTWYEEQKYKFYIAPYIKALRDVCIDYGFDQEKRNEIIESEVMRLKEQENLNIARLVIVLGTKCSLRCKECNNLMPYFKPQKDLDKVIIMESLERFLRVARVVLKCELIGGEPFLSKNLVEVLAFLLEQRKVGQIEITTNGTILPKHEVIPLLRHSKVKIRISDYGTLVDKDRLIAFLEENQIRYQVLSGGAWISSGNIEPRNRCREELCRQYHICGAAQYCKTLYDGKIFACARAASLDALGCMRQREYLEVNEDINMEKIREFWLKDYSIACDYCDMGTKDSKRIPPAEQL